MSDASISIPDEFIQPTALQRTVTSSLGVLDTLPIELLRIILNSSDFQSLSRFVQVCHLAKTLVDSLSSYQHITKHASATLIALSRTNLITSHAAPTIHAALLADRCASCQESGPFLFLPTCQRCCYRCLRTERFLRLITLRLAGICFGLSRTHLAQIPMITLLGRYPKRKATSRIKGRVFSLKHAEQLGISIHGSQEAMISACVSNAKILRTDDRLYAQWVSGATINWAYPPIDPYFGVASISFPSLQCNGELDKGLWCFGCRETTRKFSRYGIFNSDTSLCMSDLDLTIHLEWMDRRARSKSEFLEHLRSCEGARDLLRKT